MNRYVMGASNEVRLVVLYCVIALVAESAFAYEEATHVYMTWQAYQRSQLGTSIEQQKRIGIEGFLYSGSASSAPVGTDYVDIGSEIRQRRVTGRVGEYDERFFPADGRLAFAITTDKYKLGSWFMRGASREDDLPWMPFLANDDPVNAIRPLNHFFDPVHNIPLTLGGAIAGARLGKKNPDWALGATDAFSDANARDELRQNHFSAFDAREAMWRALTLRDKNMSPEIGVAGIADGESLRKAYWATTFRALGDLVHMIQDMGQPQHTRNEPHNGLGTNGIQQAITGHKSVFEKYVDARATGKPGYAVTGSGNSAEVTISSLDSVFEQTYPVPQFANYTDYFSTTVASSPSASYAKAGYGLADYSNRRFFTAVKNLGHADFQLPVSNSSAYARCKNPDGSDLTSTRWDGTPNPNGYKATALCVEAVQDELNASQNASNVALTAESVWDAALSSAGLPKTYHMTREVYDAQALLLIPRAVAYSAGIIDYFFRGSMQISLPDDGVYAAMDQSQFTPVDSSSGFTKVKLKLANTTPVIGTGQGSAQDMTGGRLVAVAKFRRAKTTYSTDLSGDCGAPNQSFPACRGDVEDIITSVAVPSVNLPAGGAPQEFQFTFSEAIPLNVTDLYLQVVYRGPLGSEADAVVVTTKNIPEPTHLSIFNLTDSVACYKGAWVKLNADGSVPAVTAATIVADGYNPASLAPQTFVRSSVTFKGPFTYPLSANGPLATVTDMAPGRFYRLAVLTDDQKAFDYDIETYQFYTERPLTTAANSIDYDTGMANTMSSSLTKIRDANTFVYRFGYRFLGADCANTPSPPLDAAAAGGGTFPTPILVPVNTISF